MAESMPVRCPACLREHLYAAPSYPCACGAPVRPSLDPRATATAVTHRVWDEQWITVDCTACGRRDQWPHPELGCPCGTVLRIPVARSAADTRPTAARAADSRARDVQPPPGTAKLPGALRAPQPSARPRRAFQPVTIRTARDAVTAAALYLRWLGYQDIRRADQRPPSGVGLAARGVLAQVDPTVSPASLRDIECLWLTAMAESSDCVYFSLAGYEDEARAGAENLGVPLFVLDLTGTPQPVNSPADDLDATGV
ncbi:hypothetical protein ACOT81_45085 [Streptomyces sp. WI04-05B]|uniref:hypothetical protein n=1 Tax=Streptomyces TaxID=1883 RepID=UPI0029BB2C7A|nr:MULTISPECIES: hypothetical protein [unclassified Streptomyces]MDX2543433.1 hypothetical protein [Streptomyces sp. WI04-05B]MDX2589102.1 hypothetical protein [Streptomyces sp. WI04-05A]